MARRGTPGSPSQRDQMRRGARGGITTPQKPHKPRVLPIPTNPFAPWSNALIQQEADRQVGNELNPQLEEARRNARADTAAITGASTAAAAILQRLAPETQQAYLQAAQELGSLGSGYSAGMRERLAGEQAQGQAFAASQGTPQQAAPVDPNAVSDVLHQGGVMIPSEALAREGAAATASNLGLVGAGAVHMQQDVNERMAQSEQELLDLAKQRPELRDKILNELYQRETDKLQGRLQSRQTAVQERAQGLYEKQFGETTRHHIADERAAARRAKISEQNYNLQVSKYQTAIDKAAAENRQPDSALSKTYGHIVDSNGDPILDKHGNQIPVTTKGGAGSKQNKTNVRMAGTAAASMFKDAQPQDPDFPGGPNKPPKHKWTFPDAQQYLVVTYGLSRSKARQILVAAGFKPAGRSRPPRGPLPGTGPQ